MARTTMLGGYAGLDRMAAAFLDGGEPREVRLAQGRELQVWAIPNGPEPRYRQRLDVDANWIPKDLTPLVLGGRLAVLVGGFPNGTGNAQNAYVETDYLVGSAPAEQQGGLATMLNFQGKTYRARNEQGATSAYLETSLDGGATWAYGTGLGGANIVESSYRLLGVGDQIAVFCKNTAGETYCTWLAHYNDNNGQGGATVWVRLY